MFELVDAVVSVMGQAYPELADRAKVVATVLRAEEEHFFAAFFAGLRLLEREVFNCTAPPLQSASASAPARGVIPGDVAFRLYDSLGFPLDLTRIIAEERRWGVDEAAFHQRMEAQRAYGLHFWPM